MFSETINVDGQDVPRFRPLGSSSEQVGETVNNNLLWAMAAGLEGKDWWELTEETKTRLRMEGEEES
jgi:hypothetical protein